MRPWKGSVKLAGYDKNGLRTKGGVCVLLLTICEIHGNVGNREPAAHHGLAGTE